ncbi:hypothetical protein IFR05_013372 [Cadophora sp. M221]|nr:hypothetical protein IFR05_013372 [Cadophora sp. M221]
MADFTHMELGDGIAVASHDEDRPPAKLRTPRSSLPASAPSFSNLVIPPGHSSNNTRLVPFNFPLAPMTKSIEASRVRPGPISVATQLGGTNMDANGGNMPGLPGSITSYTGPTQTRFPAPQAPSSSTYHQGSGSRFANKSIGRPGNRTMNRGQAVSTPSSIQVSTNSNGNAATHTSSPATPPTPVFGGSSIVLPRSARNPLSVSSPPNNNSANSNDQNPADLGTLATSSSTPSPYVASRASTRTTIGKGRRAPPQGGGARG